MKNIIILILCGIFLISCQENKKDIQKSVLLPKIEIKEEIISPEYEIYNGVIKKLQSGKDTMFIFTYSSAFHNKYGVEFCKYCKIDTTKLFVEKVILGKEVYSDFIRKANESQDFDRKFIKGENIIVNDSSQLNKLANDHNRYNKSFYRNMVINFSPVGLNKAKSKALVITETVKKGNITKQYYLFVKENEKWTISNHRIAGYGIACY